MALRNLVESQCGEGNPLLSLTHHITRDKAHKEDTHFSVPNHEVENYKTPYGGPVSPEQLAEEFMNETRNAATTTPQAFRMDTLLQEMQAIERVPPMLGPAVADLASEAGTWCKEYLDSDSYIKGHPNENNLVNELDFSNQPKHWFLQAEAQWNQATSKVDDLSGAAKWGQEYNPQEDSELAKTANEILGTVEDPKFSNTEFMKYIRTLGKGNQSESAKGWQDEFLSTPQMFESNFWSREFTDTNPISAESWGAEFLKEVAANSQGPAFKPSEWRQEFEEAQKKATFENVVVDSESLSDKEKEDFWQKWQQDWNKAAKEDHGAHPWLSDFEADYSEPFKEYTFKEDNPLKEHPDPLSEGKKCLEMGDIPSAVLCFEAAVQQSPQSSEAWLLLGNTHAENEQDPSAIPALKKGVELDCSNLDGWMALATSYTNEAYQNFACHALQEWIRNNTEYSHLIDTSKTFTHPKSLVASLAPREQIDEIQNLYLKAANLRPADQMDGNVQCGLGILLNLTGDYEKAVDCFQSAIQSKQTDPQLWNKLGATLANSNRSAEAVDAYRSCLEISPGFIRCRYNLGIACINLGAHKEAMEHFLEALNMQEKSRGAESQGPSLAVSDNIWSTVRICLKNLDAQHLMNAVYNRDLKKLNQEFGAGNSS